MPDADAPAPPPPTPQPPSLSTASADAVAQHPRIYVSTQGDVWDVIAMKVYGFKRGNERLMFRLIEANYHLRNIAIFPAGIGVIVPEVDIEFDVPLVPWKKASIVP